MSSSHFESLYPPESWSKEIKQILTFVREGNSSQLIGLPGVGRSNLLKILSYNKAVLTHHTPELTEWMLFILVDFSEIKNKPLAELKKFLFLSILDTLRESGKEEEYEKVNNVFKESLYVPVIARNEEDPSLSLRAKRSNLHDRSGQAPQSLPADWHGQTDELVLFNGLKRAIDFLSIEKELTVVFLFDKFETCIKNVSEEFFSELAVLRSRAKYRFSTVFSLDRPLEDYFEPSFMENLYPTLAGHNIFLPLSDKTSIEFRVAYIQKTTGKTLPEEILDEIFKLTGGHGNYTRIATEELCANPTVIATPSESRGKQSSSEEIAASSRQGGTPRNDKLFDFLVNNRAIRSVSYELWETLTAEEQKFLISSCHAELVSASLPSRQAGQEILNQVQDDKKKNYLEQCGLLKNNHLTIPLFEDFVKFRAEKKTIEKILFDSSSNEIKRGEFSISDQLTGLEFRLLKFFLDNENTILDREVVINGVWKDSASTAGVTDQALDQLIFRVRRKIEDDPNNPTHLLTIKGRGFKFAS